MGRGGLGLAIDLGGRAMEHRALLGAVAVVWLGVL